MGDSLSRYQQQKQAPNGQGRNRIIAIGVIIATLPFYCVGLVAYFLAPNDPLAPPTPTPTATVTSLPTEIEDQPTNLPTLTLVPTDVFAPEATTAFGVPATVVPLFTATRLPTNTPAATATRLPTNTPAATATPTNTPAPEITATPIPFDS